MDGKCFKTIGSQTRLNEQKRREWNRKIFSLCWIASLVMLGVELFLFLFYQPNEECGRAEYLYLFVVRPSALQFLAVGVFQLLFSRFLKVYSRRLVSLYTILLVTVVAGIAVCVHTSVRLMPMILVMPMLLTPLYKDWLMTLLQAALLMLAYTADLLYFIPNSPYMPQSSRLVEISIFIGGIVATCMMLKHVNESLVVGEELSRRDSLTRLYNHEVFYEELEYLQEVFERDGTGFSVMIGDIDNFKSVNDTFGHAFGDEVLRYVSRLFLESGGYESVCARYGGEEFTMILPGRGARETAARAEDIRRKFEAHTFETPRGAAHFTISFGVAEYDRSYPNPSAFFEEADRALYEAKKNGKNRVVLGNFNEKGV